MADKTIDELYEATQVNSTDLFVLQQNSTAKKLTGQTLTNWLTSYADGHGGIQSIFRAQTTATTSISGTTVTVATATYATKRATVGSTTFTYDATNTTWKISTTAVNLSDYGITLSPAPSAIDDGATITVTLANVPAPTTGSLVDLYVVRYADQTSSVIPVANGATGATGAASYVHIRYASQQPTQDSDMGTTPDKWIGIYSGTASSAPTTYTSYTWYQYKGDTGATGTAASISSTSVTYAASTSGTVTPSTWQSTIPSVTPGQYLWTKTVITFNTGSPITFYSSARQGQDGSGSVSTVNNVQPASGNVQLDGGDINVDDDASTTQTIKDAISGHTTSISDINTALELKQTIANKVTSITSSSTDTEYPSAKCVYDAIANKVKVADVTFTISKTIDNATTPWPTGATAILGVTLKYDTQVQHFYDTDGGTFLDPALDTSNNIVLMYSRTATTTRTITVNVSYI